MWFFRWENQSNPPDPPNKSCVFFCPRYFFKSDLYRSFKLKKNFKPALQLKKFFQFCFSFLPGPWYIDSGILAMQTVISKVDGHMSSMSFSHPKFVGKIREFVQVVFNPNFARKTWVRCFFFIYALTQIQKPCSDLTQIQGIWLGYVVIK